ncbi:MAG: cdd [Gammaproteobacteria bacterium]|jgi:cytidine deaminase|nr:cdd [Gammaproteobacteria bacterium]
MPLLIRSPKPLSQAEIFENLKTLRAQSVTPLSHYNVSALVEIELGENEYAYVGGVNIEHGQHNRLSPHSEQSAIINAISLFGGDTKFSKIWIMAAPEDALPDPTQKAGKSCGHCRQIMISLSKPGAEIYTVTLDGRFLSPPDTFENRFLPDPFSERDLASPSPEADSLSSPSLPANPGFFNSPKLKAAWEILQEPNQLPPEQIAKYLRRLSPHIVSEEFKTSTLTACIAECQDSDRTYYALGVLGQDVAFLTTDAIFSLICNATVQSRNKGKLRFNQIHLASSTLDAAQLTFTEIETLAHRYAHNKTLVHFYTPDGQHASYTFSECKRARNAAIDKMLDSNSRCLAENVAEPLRAKL